MKGPTPDRTPRNEKRDDRAEQPADPLAQGLKALFDDSLLDGAAFKGTPFDVSKEMAAPIDWRSTLTGIGGDGPIFSLHSEIDSRGSAPVDQRTAPPVDFKLARRFVRGKLDDGDAKRVETLSERYLSWELAVGAATMEREWKTGKVAPVDFEQARKYVRNELTADGAQSVRAAFEKYQSWKIAIAAAEVELVCLGDKLGN